MASRKNGGREHGSIEIYFAKKLANNDKKIRDRAVRRMKVWLSTREGESMTSLDMMKLWKGLFYCMWFSDKPLIQEDLAQALANLVHSLKDSAAVCKLIEGFFMTMGREWHGIDRLRLDKFYMLVRKMLKEIFEHLLKEKWNQAEIAAITNVFTNGPCSISSEKFADGIKMFVAETILDELAKVAAEEQPNPQTVSKLIDPFLILWAQTENILVFRSIESSILKRLLPTSEDKIAELEADCSMVAERVFELASKPEVSTKARKVLFKYSNLYKEAASLKEQESAVVEEKGEKSNSQKKKLKKRKLEKEEKIFETEVGKKKKRQEQSQENDGRVNESQLDENDKSVDPAEELSSAASAKERRKRKKEKGESNKAEGKLEGHKLAVVDGEAAVSDGTAEKALSFSSKKERRKKKKEEKQPGLIDGKDDESKFDETDNNVAKSVNTAVEAKQERRKKKKQGKNKQPEESDGKINGETDRIKLDEDNKKVEKSISTAEETVTAAAKKEKRKKKKQEKALQQVSDEKGDKKGDVERVDDVVETAASKNAAEEALQNASIDQNTSLVENNGEVSFSVISTSQTNDLNVDNVAQKLDFNSSFAIGTEEIKENKGKRNKKKGKNKGVTVSDEHPNDAVEEEQSTDDTIMKSQSKKDGIVTQDEKKEDTREGKVDDSSKPATKAMKKVSKSAIVRRSKRVIEKNEMSKEEMETPLNKKKKVIFELSRNDVTSISNLKVSPAVVFTPDQKPSKGVLKTSSKRRRASDFF